MNGYLDAINWFLGRQKSHWLPWQLTTDSWGTLANVPPYLVLIFIFYFIIYKIDKEYYEYKTTQNPRSMDLSHCSKEQV